MKSGIFILIFSLISFLLVANPRDVSFHHLNVENGLSQSWVMCIDQDSLGFIWFGTSNGLNKYDGYNFTVFTNNAKDENSIVNDHVQALDFDELGNLWLGTNAGLCNYNYVNNNFKQESNFTKNSINCLIVSSNYLYAGTSDGIFIYDITLKKALNSLCDSINSQFVNRRINAITHDKEGKIWIGTSEGLFVFNPKSHVLMREINKTGNYTLTTKYIRAIEVDYRNRVWIGTSENGLYYLPDATQGVQTNDIKNYYNRLDNQTSISAGKIQALKVDNNEKLLIGIENGGLDIVDLSNFDATNVSFSHNLYNPIRKNGLSNNSVYSIFEDNRGDIWVGTYGGGVNFYNNDGDNFNVYAHIHNEPNSLINNIVNVIKKDHEDLWVGTEGGISIIDLKTNKYKHLTHDKNNPNSLSGNAIWSIYFDCDDNAWVGTWANGLNCIDKKRKTITYFKKIEGNENSLGADNIFAITEDDKHNLWLATLGGGLNKYLYEQKILTRISIEGNIENSSLINEINHVYFNTHGELWFATAMSIGFIDLNTSVVKHFYHNTNDTNSFIGIGAIVIFEDSKGTMWFGTDGGLNYLIRNNLSFKNFTIDDGLPSNSIKSIQEDNSGNLWLGTNNGLVKLNNALSLPKKPVFKTYDISDGLQGNEFNRRASFKDSSGKMYFGGPNGLTYFFPDSLKENNTIPQVAFTDFLIFNQPVGIGAKDSPLKQHISLTHQITLKNFHSVFTLNYTALSFIASEKNRYAYIMEGFESKWNYVGNKRSATYTNLNAGTYYFKVKAANNDGIWNEIPRELKITILPPWYKTRWAFGGYILVLVFSIYTFIMLSQRRFRDKEELRFEKKQREQDTELNHQRLQFFTNISHEFRTPLTLIYGPIEDILKNKANKIPIEIKGQLATIYKNALRLNRLATELMDFRKLQFNKLNMKISQQDICAFTHNVTSLFKEEADLHHVNLIVTIPNAPIFLWYDQSMIEKVLFNLLSNAFKLTPENGEIKVTITTEKKVMDSENQISTEWVCIYVTDNGPGLAPDQLEKIFERFYQADNQSKTYYSSTGIGLSLAKGLMEKHSGDITVESELGYGSTFKIWLRTGNVHFSDIDLKKAPKDIIEPEPNPLPNFQELHKHNENINKNISILIVEDNKELRKYLVQELEYSYKIFEARNGRQGIDSAIKHLPDIIVSDVLMPEIDGYELCRAIKKNESISHIPIILLTARSTVEDQIEGTEAGADGYIVKPFNPSLLKSKITQLLASRKLLFSKFSSELKILPDMDVFTNYDKDFLKRVTDFVIENISNSELSVEELSDTMHLSRSQLYRKIKSLSGHSATEFIRIIRLEQAKKFIIIHKLPISEVGYKVGFGTPSYFTKCYKEYFGKLPSEEV